MRPIPAATVTLGSGSGAFAIDAQRTVSIPAYFIDTTEVTAAAYLKCVEAGACTDAQKKNVSPHCNYQREGGEDHPINCVTQYQAVAYCKFVGKRLPTDDEWEYAARGTDRRRYPWGNETPVTQPCWATARAPNESKRGTCRAGGRPEDVSPFGVLDMSGNVAEWTSTEFCSFNDPKRCGPGNHAVRGGSWDDAPSPYGAKGSPVADVEQRIGFPPSSQGNAETGFRCVRDAR